MQRFTDKRDTLNVIFDQIGTPTYINSNQLDKKGIYPFSNEGVCS